MNEFKIYRQLKLVRTTFKVNGIKYLAWGDIQSPTITLSYMPAIHHEGQPDIWLRPYVMFMETVEVNGEITRASKTS